MLPRILIVLFVLTGIGLLYWFALMPWHTRWGTQGDETRRALPGDELVPSPQMIATHAVTIQAPPEKVWPWLVQMGQARGGLYSYDWLENLVGCDIHNVTHIVPELQNLKAGDKIRLGPEGSPFFWVIATQPGRALVLGGGPAPAQVTSTWVFALEKSGGNATRLLVRSRGAFDATLGNFIIWRVITEPLSFVMEHKMMLTIRDLAQAN